MVDMVCWVCCQVVFVCSGIIASCCIAPFSGWQGGVMDHLLATVLGTVINPSITVGVVALVL